MTVRVGDISLPNPIMLASGTAGHGAELARYLDYCAELLSLSSKLAALHVQYLNDPVVLDAVNDIETLAASLSNKIWQKIMILDIAIPETPVSSVSPTHTDPSLRSG